MNINKFLCFLTLVGLGFFAFSNVTFAAEETCAPVKAMVMITDYAGDPFGKIKFSIYNQISGPNNVKLPGEQVASGTTNEYTGMEEVEFSLEEGETSGRYLLKVDNPVVGDGDFYFFDATTVSCGSSVTISRRLGSLRVRVFNSQEELQKDARVYLYQQDYDATGQPITGDSLGSFNTEDVGQKIIYLPTKERALMPGDYYYFVVGAKGAGGDMYYKYNILPEDQTIVDVDYILSDLIITILDESTGDVIPNYQVKIYEQNEYADYDGSKLGDLVDTIKTDNQGQAYLQYPAGMYIAQYRKANGAMVTIPDIVINESKRTNVILPMANDSVGKCSVKSVLELSLRDFDEEIVSDLTYEIYQQTYNNNNQSIADKRVTSGKVDEDGLGISSFSPLPAERYILKICDVDKELGCFWYHDIQFTCDFELFFEQHINAVNIILRDTKRNLAIGQAFKIYIKETDVDGNLVLERDNLVDSFKLPASGKYTMYLSNKGVDAKKDVDYVITIDLKSKLKLVQSFKVEQSATTDLEYIVGSKELTRIYNPVDTSFVDRLRGRILLQVEERGEAWYVNPKDNKRYYLGTAEDAFDLMKKLSIGISNKNLAQIVPNLSIVRGNDSDADGIPDTLEEGLFTDPFRSDSDDDGHSDKDEISAGYNPKGSGRMRTSLSFAREQSGKILLQVEGNGEAWYVNPVDSQRYFLNRPADAYNIMRELGLGITNKDLKKIPVGGL